MRSDFLFSIISVMILCVPVQAYDWSTNPGDGTEANPYQISTPEQLTSIGYNNGNLQKELYAAHYQLANDIDMAPEVTGIPPFETALIAPLQIGYFVGTFDGNGHIISNLTIEPIGYYVSGLGLFGSTDGVTIKNLGVVNISIEGRISNLYCGGIVGWASSTEIRNCFTSGQIHAGSYIGGLVGAHEYGGVIVNCYSECSCSGEGYERGVPPDIVLVGPRVGGLIGYMQYGGTVESCFSTGQVEGIGDVWEAVGGLFGIVDNQLSGIQITNCLWDVQTSGTDQGVGYSHNPIDGIMGLSTEQMKQQANFQNWDFMGEAADGTEDIWRMCVDGIAYPKLWWEFGTGDFVCGDGVDFADYAMLASIWMLSAGQAGYNDRCDLADNDTIDLMDLAIYCDHWLDAE